MTRRLCGWEACECSADGLPPNACSRPLSERPPRPKPCPPTPCARPPAGWRCTRATDHAGPCAAVPLDGNVDDLATAMRRAETSALLDTPTRPTDGPRPVRLVTNGREWAVEIYRRTLLGFHQWKRVNLTDDRCAYYVTTDEDRARRAFHDTARDERARHRARVQGWRTADYNYTDHEDRRA